MRFNQRALIFFLGLVGMGLSPPGPVHAAEWQVGLEISIPEPAADGGRLVNVLAAGSLSTATDLYDNDADVVALLAGPLQAAFSHEGETTYPDPVQMLWRDLRADEFPKSWVIRVRSEQNSAPVTLQWTPPPAFPLDPCRQNRIWLLDQTTGQWVDLGSATAYQYASSGAPASPEVRYFALVVDAVPLNAPTAPTGLSGRGLGAAVLLSWIENAGTPVTGYHVWRRPAGDGTYSRLTAEPLIKNRYMDKTASPGNTYAYAVTAVGANGCESGYSNEAVVTGGKRNLR